MLPSEEGASFSCTKFHISLSAILAKTEGYFAKQHIPMHPCRTPRATITGGSKLLTYSINGAPEIVKKEGNLQGFFCISQQTSLHEYKLS